MAKCKNCKHLKIDSSIEKKICFLIGEIGNPDEEISCCCYRPATNADRIRSMTDEELRDFLYDMTSESQCHICAFKKGWLCEKPYDKSCHDGVMEWLKSEVGCE